MNKKKYGLKKENVLVYNSKYVQKITTISKITNKILNALSKKKQI